MKITALARNKLSLGFAAFAVIKEVRNNLSSSSGITSSLQPQERFVIGRLDFSTFRLIINLHGQIGVKVLAAVVLATAILVGQLAQASSDWSLMQSESNPPSRRSHSMTYEPEHDVVVVFGGYGNGSHLGDTWVLDLETREWRDMKPQVAPSPRAATTMVYDPDSERMVLFGGFAVGHSIVSNQTWAYSYANNTWTDLGPDNAPSERASYGMAYDSKRHLMVLFGGFTEQGYHNDTWIFDPAENSWKELQIDGEVPAARGAMGFVYQAANDVFTMFGGFSDRGFFKDTWTLDLNTATWSRADPNNSPAPIRTRMVHDVTSGNSYFFGGDVIPPESEEGAPEPYAGTWVYGPDGNWSQLDIGNNPPARSLNGIIVDAHGRLVIFGGTDTLIDDQNFLGREFHDTWILDPRSQDDQSSSIFPVLPVGIGAVIASVIAAIVLTRKKRKQNS